MIPVAFGAVAGLCLFFRGFWLLQHRPPAPAGNTLQARPAVTTITTTFTTTGGDMPPRSSTEVIRLSPANGESSGAVPVTNQGKIAAALLKAGLSTPSWSGAAGESNGTVRGADPPTKNGNGSPSAMQALDMRASRVLKQASGHTVVPNALNRPTGAGASFGWKPALMIWGGPVLTLACTYILVAHFGWL